MKFAFRLGSIPVLVRWQFLLMVLVIGTGMVRLERPDLIAVWGLVVFVSVLAHELGHALVGRRFGLVPRIELTGMGGTTSWDGQPVVTHGRAIAISAAGPLAGFLLGAGPLVLVRIGAIPHEVHLRAALSFAALVNLYWGGFNLLPMLPLDGGNIVRSGLHLVTGGRGEKPARLVSVIVALVLLSYAISRHELWLAGFAAFVAWSNRNAHRQADMMATRSFDVPLAQAIDEAYRALDRHDGARALELLGPVIVPQASLTLRGVALRIYSYALLIEGRWDELLPMLEKNVVLIGPTEMSRYAATARELGRALEATKIESLVPRPRLANDFR